jgi:exopolysaccharide biosynthesis predicted pyruvyltransferase EpsI/nitroreductase
MKRLFWVGCFPSFLRSIGDHAQTLAVEKFLSEKFSDFEIRKFYRYEMDAFFTSDLNKNDLIFIQSSGDFGDLYPEWHTIRKHIVSAYPENRIVQLPVSVYYRSPARFEEDKIFFSDKHNFLVLCRTMKDYDLLSGNFGCKVRFFPDFAFYLKPELTGSVREGVLVVLRKDAESSYRIQSYETLVAYWLKRFRLVGRILRKFNHLVLFRLVSAVKEWQLLQSLKKKYGRVVAKDVQIADVDLSDENREAVITDVLNYYQEFKVVLTDRFHALVFAYLTNTPSVALKGKIDRKTSFVKRDFAKYFSNFRNIVNEAFSKNHRSVETIYYNSQLLKLIKSRRSIRKWIDKSVAEDICQKIVEAGCFAPSAANYQGVKLKVLGNRHDVYLACQNTSPWFKHSLPNRIILILYDLKKKHSADLDFNSWHRRFIWQDTACVMMNMMLMAESLGVKTCWGTVNPEQEKALRIEFGISNRYRIASMLLMGYSNQKVNVRTAFHQGHPIKRDPKSMML